MTGLRFDPEYLKAVQSFVKGPRSDPAKRSPYPPGVTETVYKIKSYDGVEIEVTRFASEETLESDSPTPAVVYLHGGGYVSCSVQLFAPQIARFANDTKLPYFAVSYRLAPEHPAPTAVEDAYAAIQYVSDSAADLKIDPTKIAVQGDSSGAGLAAGVALMARDRQLDPPIAKQILIYPMLSDRYNIEKDDPTIDFMIVKPDVANIIWDAYAYKVLEGDDVKALSYAIPARAGTLRGLPSTYIDVGSDPWIFLETTI